MKVYVAKYGYDYEGSTVVGVFTKESSAYEYLKKNYSGTGDWHDVKELELNVGE